MKTAQIKILEVQPHNIFLAEETIDFLAAKYPHFDAPRVIRYREKLYSDDGDHRLYVFFKKGRKVVPVELYDFDAKSDVERLAAMAREQEITALMKTMRWGRQMAESFYQTPRQVDPIKKLLEDAEFARRSFEMDGKQYKGIYSVADLRGRLMSTKEDVGSCYEVQRAEWQRSLRS
jgi:hypothetical protein